MHADTSENTEQSVCQPIATERIQSDSFSQSQTTFEIKISWSKLMGIHI